MSAQQEAERRYCFAHYLRYYRDNFLILDIYFEALNYETIEQKKAYDIAGLLGKARHIYMLAQDAFILLEMFSCFYIAFKETATYVVP